MSLPFLDKKRLASTIMERRGMSATTTPETETGGGEHPLKDGAVQLLAAIERKSPIDVARAFEALFEQCEQTPHEEYEDASESE